MLTVGGRAQLTNVLMSLQLKLLESPGWYHMQSLGQQSVCTCHLRCVTGAVPGWVQLKVFLLSLQGQNLLSQLALYGKGTGLFGIGLV